jgi:hypothetical protein
MSQRGWSSSRQTVLESRLLDWIFERSDGFHAPMIVNALDDLECTSDDAEGLARTLRSQGLVKFNERMGGLTSSSVFLTDEGQQLARQQRDRSAAPRARAVASREALLDWLYTQKRSGRHSPVLTEMQSDPQGWFEGSQLTEEEIGDAGTHLKSLGLINGVSAWGTGVPRGEIEVEGEIVVEQFDSSLSEWAAGQRGSQQIVTNFHGPVSGQVGIGQVSQTQNVGVDPGALLALLADVRAAAVALDPGDQMYAGTYVDVIQAEASGGDPSPEVIKTSGERLKGIAGKAGNAGFSAAVSALVNGVTKMWFGG